MIGEEIKDTLKEISVEELRKITWDCSETDTIGLYNDNIIRGFLWDAKECSEVNPLLVGRCNVAEGWVEYIEVEDPKGEYLMVMLKEVKRDQDGNPIRTKVDCKVVVDLLDYEGNVIVTLS